MTSYVFMIDGHVILKSTCFADALVWATITKERLPDSEVCILVTIEEDLKK